MRVFEFEDFENDAGTYVAAYFHPETVEGLTRHQEALGLTNPDDPHEFHTTIVYSRRSVPWEPVDGLEVEAKPLKWEAWNTRDGKRCLVLLLDCDWLHDRFSDAMMAGATYDFPDYKPHITLSYNVDESLDPDALPLPEFPIRISHEGVDVVRK